MPITAAAVCLSLLTGSTSSAAFPAEMTLSYQRSNGNFRGEIKNQRPRCLQDRPVVLKRVRPDQDRIAARKSTNAQGVWRVYRPKARGRYYAVARSIVVENNQGSFRCPEARSLTIRVPR